jgi:hypothetical protein
MFPVIMISGFVAVFVVVIYFGKMQARKRKEGLTEFFMDLSFRNVEQPEIPSFKMTSRGHARRRYNNFQGRAAGLDISVFDYRYTTGSGKNSSTHTNTIAMTNANLPVFELSKEGFFSKIADKFTNKDIDFRDYPDFSDKYVLKAGDEQGVRAIFTSETLIFFENIERESGKRCYVESNGRELIFCTPSKRVKPENMNMFMEKTKQCFGLFVKGV